MTSPVPVNRNVRSASATTMSASRRRSARSMRQSLASSTAARGRLPLASLSLPSSFSKSAMPSAAEPAKPAMILPSPMRRTFLAPCFMIVLPWVT
jgi:hypothetical protein